MSDTANHVLLPILQAQKGSNFVYGFTHIWQGNQLFIHHQQKKRQIRYCSLLHARREVWGDIHNRPSQDSHEHWYHNEWAKHVKPQKDRNRCVQGSQLLNTRHPNTLRLSVQILNHPGCKWSGISFGHVHLLRGIVWIPLHNFETKPFGICELWHCIEHSRWEVKRYHITWVTTMLDNNAKYIELVVTEDTGQPSKRRDLARLWLKSDKQRRNKGHVQHVHMKGLQLCC